MSPPAAGGRVVVLSNPWSGRNKRDPGLADRLRALLAPPHALIEPRDPEHADDLAAALLAPGDLGVLCVNGGDGTLAHLLSAFARQAGDRPLPLVGILRGGTMNTVAHGIGLGGSPERILARILRRQAEGAPHPVARRHLMRVRDGHGPDRYGFLFGNGVVSNFLEVYYEGGDASPAKAARLLLRAVLSGLVGGSLARQLTRRVEVHVSLDGQPWPVQSFLSVTAGTVDDLGLGFRPFWAVLDHPGKLQAVGFACSTPALALRIPRTLLARPWDHPQILDRLGTRLVLRGEGRLAYMIEGDFHWGGQMIEVGVGPEVQLICA